MLPVYHRLYDEAKTLLLTIPACALLWLEGGVIGWLALLLTSVAIIGNRKIVLIARHHSPNRYLGFADTSGHVFGKLITIAVERPFPIVLLAVGVFYLWAYVRVISSGWNQSTSMDLR